MNTEMSDLVGRLTGTEPTTQPGSNPCLIIDLSSGLVRIGWSWHTAENADLSRETVAISWPLGNRTL